MRIHTGGDFDIFSHEGASPYLLVTFNEVGRLGDGAYYWGRPVVEAKNISTVAVVTRKADWFRNPEIDAYLKANPQLFARQKDVVAVGYSRRLLRPVHDGSGAARRAGQPRAAQIFQSGDPSGHAAKGRRARR